MYSSKTNVLQVVSLMAKYGINDVVLCPGSRNAPLTQTFSACNKFTCHSIVDERSAGFYAIGIALATNNPVVVCCTSGSAVLNLAPAVAEAYYQRIPLIVISADRPQAWIGQMDGQTLPQPGAFNSLVLKSVQLVEKNDKESLWYNNRQINEAMIKLSRSSRPIHINVPISEPLFDFSTDILPDERVITYTKQYPVLTSEMKDVWKKAEKVMIVQGQNLTDPYAEKQLYELAEKGCILLCEHLGNINVDSYSYSTIFDNILYVFETEGNSTDLVPDLVITCGGHIVSKRLKHFLRRLHVPHWHISLDGEVADVFQSQTVCIEGSESDALEAINQISNYQKDNMYLNSWMKAGAEILKRNNQFLERIDKINCGLRLVGSAISCIPSKSILHLGNSTVVRLAQLFPKPYKYTVYCNRGMNGIEGSLSTAVGYASKTKELNFVLIGDLSFFYDMNVLRHAGKLNNLRIILINNGVGEIFSTLPGLNKIPEFDKYIAASHKTKAEGWARQVGFSYIRISDLGDYYNISEKFYSEQSSHPMLMEVMTDPNKDKQVYEEYFKFLLK